MDNFTKFPNNIYDALLSYGLTRIQLHVVLYVIRKTDGWGKISGDHISISKMAKDMGFTRPKVAAAIHYLHELGVLEVYDGNTTTSVKFMRVTGPESWKKEP